MKIEIDDSIREAGLGRQVESASKLLAKVVARSLQPRVAVTWSALTNAHGKRWVMAAFSYDPRTTELAVFAPESLEDADYMRERLDRLWSSVLRTRLLQDLDEPLSAMVGAE